MRPSFVNLKNARNGVYKKVLERIYSKGICPFCPDYFKYHKKPIFQRKNGWFLTENSWPYKNTQHHFIIIGDTHKENFSELTKKDFEAVAYLTRWAIKKYKIQGGAFAMRFGNTSLTGASVAHIHFHIISPAKNKKTHRAKPVSFPLGGKS